MSHVTSGLRRRQASRSTAKRRHAGAALSYGKDVRPILERNCLSCHGGKNKRGGVDVGTYAAASKAVKPGKPDDSPLYESVASGAMPPMKPTAVTAAERNTLREWIAQGAKP